MPIKSYLALAHSGRRDELRQAIHALGCHTVAAQNDEVLIVLTDTPSESEDERLLEALQRLEALRHLTLVAAFGEEEVQPPTCSRND